MRILLTGSAGWLGQTLAPRLEAGGHEVIGLDPVASPRTAVRGSVTDRDLVRSVLREARIEAIVHAGGLHKPDIDRFSRADFMAVNIHGTFNLLDAAVEQGIDRFVFTSTTSLMISAAIRAGLAGGAARASWLTEDMVPEPRNIYGVTKLAAEKLCRFYHDAFGMKVVVLRTARFFPEADDMAHAIDQSDENTKANELLFRRLTVADAAEAHIRALQRAPELGYGLFIISAATPFTPADCDELIGNAPAVVARYFPNYPALYARRGWTMFHSIDRVYDSSLAAQRLGFVCRTGFRDVLAGLAEA
ncbi:NAD-dependent epimerase/dehydratase family protein [Phreatobacter sp. AB_2022a]|uniref:NAD-dependent epimerase/dehydratase family protein n=1 Tax=Phreatobacter sp. AB_2022a TaxID=3003134 RepID=UPI002286EA4C|nr:NAD(P)-dependent oxidoreductase [Phreatobacter sp. AB_2022a]MCZ0732778.1 NAD(P)-dependent oxidoreductase [Phreatobacter sp. AB_2022a]